MVSCRPASESCYGTIPGSDFFFSFEAISQKRKYWYYRNCKLFLIPPDPLLPFMPARCPPWLSPSRPSVRSFPLLPAESCDTHFPLRLLRSSLQAGQASPRRAYEIRLPNAGKGEATKAARASLPSSKSAFPSSHHDRYTVLTQNIKHKINKLRLDLVKVIRLSIGTKLISIT